MATIDSRAEIDIDVLIRTRAVMNTATPRLGSWTYHHIHPVRIYYLAASMIARFITDPNCYEETRRLGTIALCQMTNSGHNSTAIRTFVDQHRDKVTSDDDRNAVAKLCASPLFGGFGGVNPSQRTDDPKDKRESIRPLSAPLSWWESVGRIGDHTMKAFGLTQLPVQGDLVSARKMAYEWNEIVVSLISDISHASVCGAAPFVRKDWNIGAGGQSWTVPLAAATAPNPAKRPATTVYPGMALRTSGTMYTYLDPEAIPVASMNARGVVPLVVRRGADFLDYL